MTMTETEELTWMRVLFIEDSPIECNHPDCVLEAKWRHTCPGCHKERLRCGKYAHTNPKAFQQCAGINGCFAVFDSDEWFVRSYLI